MDELLSQISNYLGLGGLAGGFAVWRSRENKADIDELREQNQRRDDELKEFRQYASDTYAKHTDMTEVKEMLREIRGHLLSKK